MQKIFLVLFTSLFLLSCQTQKGTQTKKEIVVKNKKSLLWEISGNGLKKPSYIFGTIHMIPKDDYFFTDIMQEKIQSCSTLALEIDMNMSMEEQMAMGKQVMFPNGKKLSDYMTEKEYQKYSTYVLDTLKINKLMFQQMNMIKPIFASTIVLTQLIGESKAYEQELTKIAKTNNINIIGLETIAYQMNVLDKISIEKQIEMVASDEAYKKHPLDEYNKMLQAYKEQDLDKLMQLMQTEETIMEFMDELLYTRNSNWIPIIEKQIKTGSTFVAVGAGHLAGEKGVLNLLKEKGYSVSAVR